MVNHGNHNTPLYAFAHIIRFKVLRLNYSHKMQMTPQNMPQTLNSLLPSLTIRLLRVTMDKQ